MKIVSKTKDFRLLVKVKTSFRETIDTKEVDRFARVYLRCFLKPKLLKSNLIEYSGPVGITLRDRMKKEISKRDFLFILEHIVVAVQKLQANNFFLGHLQIDMQHIFINENTKELQFLYVPIIESTEPTSVEDLLSSVIYSAHPMQENDTEYVSRFNYFLRSLSSFSIDKVEQFIQKEDRSIVNTIKKNNAGQSGFMTSSHKHYYEHIEEQEKVWGEENTGLLEDVEDPTGLLTDEQPTGLLIDTQEDADYLDDEATGYLVEEEPAVFMDEMATGLLGDYEDEGTALLNERAIKTSSATYPELFRVLTGEVIRVDKPVFRLGKERSYVDYFVTNNNAVSRSHADIISRGTGFFVIDLNSKNRTYINGQALAAQVETRINNGDTLHLGNEEFIFRTGGHSVMSPVCPQCKASIIHDSNFCPFCGCKL